MLGVVTTGGARARRLGGVDCSTPREATLHMECAKLATSFLIGEDVSGGKCRGKVGREPLIVVTKGSSPRQAVDNTMAGTSSKRTASS